LEFPSERRFDKIRGNRQARMLTVTPNGSKKGFQARCTVAGGSDSPTGCCARVYVWWRDVPPCAVMRPARICGRVPTDSLIPKTAGDSVSVIIGRNIPNRASFR
jgi:hypothetical protein